MEKVQHRARKMINEVEHLSYEETLDNLLHGPWFFIGSCGLFMQALYMILFKVCPS